MKKILSALLIAVLTVAAVLTLTACKPSGKYATAEVAGIQSIYEFSGNKWTLTVTNPITADVVTNGTFKMVKEDDVEYIEFTLLDKDGEKVGEPEKAKYAEGKDDDGNKYITIGAFKFFKK